MYEKGIKELGKMESEKWKQSHNPMRNKITTYKLTQYEKTSIEWAKKRGERVEVWK